MGRRKVAKPAGGSSLETTDIVARTLLTIRSDHAVWAQDQPFVDDELAGQLVRIEPPATATARDIDWVRNVIVDVAGATAVRVMPRAAQQAAQGPVSAPKAPAHAQSHRERVMTRAAALVGVRDMGALNTALDAALSSAGL